MHPYASVRPTLEWKAAAGCITWQTGCRAIYPIGAFSFGSTFSVTSDADSYSSFSGIRSNVADEGKSTEQTKQKASLAHKQSTKVQKPLQRLRHWFRGWVISFIFCLWIKCRCPVGHITSNTGCNNFPCSYWNWKFNLMHLIHPLCLYSSTVFLCSRTELHAVRN